MHIRGVALLVTMTFCRNEDHSIASGLIQIDETGFQPSPSVLDVWRLTRSEEMTADNREFLMKRIRPSYTTGPAADEVDGFVSNEWALRRPT